MSVTVPQSDPPETSKLGVEVRQSLSLIVMTAITLMVSIGIGILAGHLG